MSGPRELLREVAALGGNPRAIAALDSAVAEGTDENLLALAAARFHTMDIQGSMESARKALALSPDRHEAHMVLGSALFEQGRVDDALASYRRALKVKPDHPDALFHIGLVNLSYDKAAGEGVYYMRMAPGAVTIPHTHGGFEDYLILEGELIIGRKHLGPGASVFVAGNTLYGFRTGPAGARFLNFRGKANTSFISREEYLAARETR